MTYLPYQITPNVSFLPPPPSKVEPEEIEQAEKRKQEDAKKYGDQTSDSTSESPPADLFPGQQ